MGLFSKKSKKPAAPTVGVFGKHPSAREFFRSGGSRTEIDALDRWLSEAMASGQRAVGDWSEVYDRSPTTFFLMHSGGQHHDRGRCLFGVMSPSEDAAGRRFPLVLFTELDRASIIDHYPALPYHPFLGDLSQLLAHQLSSDQPPVQSVSKLRPPSPGDLDRAVADHASYIDSTDCGAAFGAAFSGTSPGQHERAFSLLRTVCWSTTSLSNLPRYGLRCPLSQRYPAATAGLWLALLQHLVRVPALPNALWNARSLVLFAGELSRKALTALWCPGWQDDTICDLATVETESTAIELFIDRPLKALFT